MRPPCSDTAPSPRTFRHVATGLCVLAVTSCSRGVEVAPLPRAGDPACAAAAREWPDRVVGLERRPVAGDASAAAWGDPAVVARCGGEAPAPTQDPCVTVEGVDWVMADLSDGRRFVTFGRSPALEVLVPHAHAPEPEVLPRLAAAARRLPATGHRCG